MSSTAPFDEPDASIASCAPERSRSLRLAARATRLSVQAPFHLEATVRVLQRRPANLIDRWDGQHYLRTIRIGGCAVLIKVENRGTIDAPDLRLTTGSDETHLARKLQSSGNSLSSDVNDAAARVVAEILGLDLDPDPARHRARAEPALRRTAIALRGLRPPRYPDLFETVANVIPFQQVSLAAGMTVVQHLIRRFGGALTCEGHRYPLFPSAEVVADARIASLRGCGMSARKSEALRGAARAIARGELTAGEIATLPSSDAALRLMQLQGIGPWSSALILLRGFRRLDVFPRADTGAQSSLAALMQLRSHASLDRLVERFGEYRGYLYFYGLASRLLSAGLIHAAPAVARTARVSSR